MTLIEATPERSSYEVVDGTHSQIHYRVYLSSVFYKRVSGRQFTHEWVIVQAFQYLLEQEGNIVLSETFDLEDLATRFPEFETSIKERLHAPNR